MPNLFQHQPGVRAQPTSRGEGWREGVTVQRYEADLHIHTLLSPCGEIEMIPSLIIEAAARAGLDIIAIADHNSCENAGAVIEAAEDSGVRVLPGLEVQSVEGVHLLCLFDEIDQAHGLQDLVYAEHAGACPSAKLCTGADDRGLAATSSWAIAKGISRSRPRLSIDRDLGAG